MSAAGETGGRAKAKEDANPRGAKPRPEGRVREDWAAADNETLALHRRASEAARRRAIECGRHVGIGTAVWSKEAEV